MNSIFVNICSYRDNLLIPTIRSLMETESGRNKITYGVFEQTAVKDSLVTLAPDLANSPNVRYKRIDPEYSSGVVWARAINAMQINDEQFQYQIDSHMLFDNDWDNQLILDYNQTRKLANTDKIILTAGTKNYDVIDEKITKHTLTEDITVKLGYYRFNKNLRLSAHGPWTNATNVSTPSIHICAGNFFAPSKWVREAGYNTRIYFEGEEQMLALMSFLAGYKIFHQRRVRCYHYLRSSNHETKQTINPVIDYDTIRGYQSRSEKELIDFIYSIDEEKLEEFRKLTGVDYINRKLEERAITPKAKELLRSQDPSDEGYNDLMRCKIPNRE